MTFFWGGGTQVPETNQNFQSSEVNVSEPTGGLKFTIIEDYFGKPSAPAPAQTIPPDYVPNSLNGSTLVNPPQNQSQPLPVYSHSVPVQQVWYQPSPGAAPVVSPTFSSYHAVPYGYVASVSPYQSPMQTHNPHAIPIVPLAPFGNRIVIPEYRRRVGHYTIDERQQKIKYNCPFFLCYFKKKFFLIHFFSSFFLVVKVYFYNCFFFFFFLYIAVNHISLYST